MPKFTDEYVAGLVCPTGKKDVLVFDGNPKGFGVRVLSNGRKIFILQYTVAKRKPRMPLGYFGKGRGEGDGLTTKEARVLASIHYGTVLAGGDPHKEVAEKKASHAAAAAEEAFTFRTLVNTWENRHLDAMRESYRKDALGRIRLHLTAILDKPASAVTRKDAVKELDRIAIEAGETTARRVMGYARSAYGWALKRGSVDSNPFHGLPRIGKEVSRDRALCSKEVGAVWTAAGKLGTVHGGFVRFLLLTLARRDEVARMTWAEVAPDLSTWTLPAERAKNGKAHVVHLSKPARAVLAAVPRIDGCPLVFTTTAKKGLTTFSWIMRKLTAPEIAEGWTLHDFRRTGVSTLANLGYAPHVCDRLLNHTQGTIKGVAAIYQRHDFAKERTAALDAWGTYVLKCSELQTEAKPKGRKNAVVGDAPQPAAA
jgi:integrase